MQKYAKAITALIGALATWGITAAEDSTYTQVELWGGLLAIVTALGVFVVPNEVARRRNDRGHADLVYLAIVALVAAAVTVLMIVFWGDELLK